MYNSNQTGNSVTFLIEYLYDSKEKVPMQVLPAEKMNFPITISTIY